MDKFTNKSLITGYSLPELEALGPIGPLIFLELNFATINGLGELSCYNRSSDFLLGEVVPG